METMAHAVCTARMLLPSRARSWGSEELPRGATWERTMPHGAHCRVVAHTYAHGAVGRAASWCKTEAEQCLRRTLMIITFVAQMRAWGRRRSWPMVVQDR
eukprot:147387-Pelagomonas_calceolata.AAC.1